MPLVVDQKCKEFFEAVGRDLDRMEIVDKLSEIMMSMTQDESYTASSVYRDIKRLTQHILMEVRETGSDLYLSLETHASVRM